MANDHVNHANGRPEEVSLAHLVRGVVLRSSHQGSSPQGHEFGFLLFQNKIDVGAYHTAFPFKKMEDNLIAHSNI